METQSIFEQINEWDVSHWVNLLALATLGLGLLCGLVLGRLRKEMKRCLILGLLAGMTGPALAISWHVYDARTSYSDYEHRAKNPDRERFLWRIVGAGKLDSVSNVAGLVVGAIVAGILAGFGCSLLLNWVDRRYPGSTTLLQPSESKQATESPRPQQDQGKPPPSPESRK